MKAREDVLKVGICQHILYHSLLVCEEVPQPEGYAIWGGHGLEELGNPWCSALCMMEQQNRKQNGQSLFRNHLLGNSN